MKKKSHSGLKKRIKITGKGKVKFTKSAKKHLLVNKSKRQKKLNRGGKVASASDTKWIKKLIA
ncbi:50S ribosomal protein L35 [Candidatus Peregrinibacteria bacterium]|nr:50S ribosomal protein L35 [Candidatus Peregrinibacteria bacterium]